MGLPSGALLAGPRRVTPQPYGESSRPLAYLSPDQEAVAIRQSPQELLVMDAWNLCDRFLLSFCQGGYRYHMDWVAWSCEGS